MRPRIILLLSVIVALFSSTQTVYSQVRQGTDDLMDYIQNHAGPKFDCYFVLEDDQEDGRRKDLIGDSIAIPPNLSSVDDLVTYLRSHLPGFAVIANQDKKIVTIVNQNPGE